MQKRETRGGAGRGQGRKPVAGERAIFVTVSLPPHLLDYAESEALGNGNRSAGIRAALMFHAQHAKREKTG